MVKFFTGKFGRTAPEQFAKDLRRQSRFGKLPNISKKEREQVIEITGKVFKDKFKFKQRDLEKEVLNRLRLSNKDFLSSKEVDEVDKAIGISDHTKTIGVKYPFILRQEKKAEYQKHLEELKISKNISSKESSKNTTEIKKTSSEPSRYEILRAKIAETALKRKEAMSNRFPEGKQESGMSSHGRYDENDRKLGGVKANGAGNRKISHAASEHGSMSHEAAPRRESSMGHAETFSPSSGEFGK